jgi:hypothetical protein
MGQLEAIDMKFGLIAVDRRELDSDPNSEAVILHFCGYATKPTKQDVDLFFNTMATTPEFGVMDIMEFIDVYEAEDSIIEQYRNDLLNGTIIAVNILDENGSPTFDPNSGTTK